MQARVALVDDGTLAMRGAMHILSGAPEIHFLGGYPGIPEITEVKTPETAGSPDRSRAAGWEEPPLVVVMDPFVNGESCTPELAESAGAVAVLAMSALTTSHHVREALRSGALGYIDTGTCAPKLLAAVRTLSAGGVYLSAPLAQALAQPDLPAPHQADGGRKFELTQREQEVLVMIARGMTHKQIGTRLDLSKATVDTYVHRIRQKVGAVNKAGLTRVAMDMGLLNLAGA